jgi:hypothetical protein
MKYFISIFLLFFCLNLLSAQEKHFVFIQSESKQPFYVSVNGKLYSSSASGYVIIPKLSEGNYTLTVGFAQNAFPEQTFTAAIENKDLGFELKNMADKGWALFNLQSLDLSMATTTDSNVVAKALSETSGVKPVDDVINFPKKKKVVQDQVKPDSDSMANRPVATVEGAKEAVIPDTVVGVDQKETDRELASQTAPKKKANSRKSPVKKVSEVSSSEGVSLAYVEGTGKNADTIHVVIPASPADQNAAVSKSPAPDSNDTKVTTDQSNTDTKNVPSKTDKGDPKFLDINVNGTKDSSAAPAGGSETAKIMENSNCKNVATDEDYTRLRKKMAYETSDEKMIAEAKKYYKNKCFTTEQIKRLSTLFLSDEGRLNFFNASIVSVADASHYRTLETEFIDPAYATRFKNLFQ